MRVRSILLLCILLPTAVSLLHAAPVAAQSTTASSPLGMGFSPGTITPIGEGTPVYTVGDQLWVMSMSQTTMMVTVTDAAGSQVAQAILGPTGVLLFHNFSSSDTAGTWHLDASVASTEGSGTPLVQNLAFQFVDDQAVSPDLAGDELTDYGRLSLNFTTDAPDSYDVQACTVGSSVPATVPIPVPSSLGAGQLLLEKTGDTVQIAPSGQTDAPFNFWIELHQDYSYSVGGGSTFVSRDIRAAATSSVPITPGTSSAVNATIDSFLHLRTGRFTLRAFFDGSAGLSVYETQALILTNGSWIWLGGCTASASVSKETFSLGSSLLKPAAQWPRDIYLMYDEGGIDIYSSTAIAVMPAVVQIVAAPWGTNLTDTQLALLPNAQVENIALGDGMVYLTAAQYPVQLGVSLLAGGQAQTIQVARPFSTSTLNVSSAKIVVSAVVGGGSPGDVGITVRNAEDNRTLAAATTTENGEAIFYVPVGNFTIAAAYGGATQTSAVQAKADEMLDATFTFEGPTAQSPSYLLIGTAVVGVIASLCVWVMVYRRRS